MSPFSQLSSAISPLHPSIDHNFSPILNYLDEFDRHFSHRHRFINCFIPRFDLEEDASNYYLYGEVPGARVEDINIEASDEKTLVVSGVTHRPGPLGEGQNKHEGGEVQNGVNSNGKREAAANGNTYIDVDASNAGHPAPGTTYTPPPSTIQYPTHDYSDPSPPAPHPNNLVNVDVSNAGVPNPHSQPNNNAQFTQTENQQQQQQGGQNRRVLLSERILGDFNRTFTFPSNVVEEGIKASVVDGVLFLVVPKREGGGRRGRRIPVLGGFLGKRN